MIIRREALKALLPCTRHDTPVDALDALQITPDGRVRASNGYTLLEARDRYPFDDADFPTANLAHFDGNPPAPVEIGTDIAKKLMDATPAKSPIPILQAIQIGQEADQPFAQATDRTVPLIVKPLPERPRFPTVDKVLETARSDRPSLTFTLSATQLEILIKAAKAVRTSKREAWITFTLPTEEQYYFKDPTPDAPVDPGTGTIPTQRGALSEPLRVQVTGDDIELDGVIMPGRP